MPSVKEQRSAQAEAAAARFEERADKRRANIELIETPGGIARADSEERVRKRLARLRRYYAGETLPKAITEAPTRRRFVRARDGGREAEPGGVDPEAVVLEKIINTADFVDIRYLEGGVAAARAVCRINIRDQRGLTGYGTGSLVSPRLVLTNHHVLPNAATAATSQLEFNYQDGVDGQPLQPRLLPLDPGTFFLADRKLDFALVAVAAGESALAQFGFNPLIATEGKAIVGEFVTIVQHPRGQKKQVALRENTIVDILENFLHYEADTEPGSSGSPVFNDQWEVVALHHASVAAPDRPELGGFQNEGIRISRILRFVAEQQLGAEARALVDQLKGAERVAVGAPPPAAAATAPEAPAAAPSVQAGEGALRVTIPIEVTVRVPGVAGGRPVAPAAAAAPAFEAPPAGEEKIEIDPDYSNRRGYDAEFLGKKVPLPTLPKKLLDQASRRREGPAATRHVIPYHHFSVVMNKERRLAFFTAVNIDGKLIPDPPLKREEDRWFFDPRIPEDEQTGEPVYAKNPLDRGHLVRRLDPAWGRTRAEAKRANDDTFHFTNCTPQHEEFNQNKTTWAGLEDYILDNAENEGFKVSVFTGPVLAAGDDEYRDVKLPREYWKVVVMRKRSGELSATGYLLSQSSLIDELETLEEFSYGAYRTYQVPVRRIQRVSGLSFGDLVAADPLEGLEAEAAIPREIGQPEDIVV